MARLNALILNCTLKPAPTSSSTEVLGFTIPANGVTYWVGEAMQTA